MTFIHNLDPILFKLGPLSVHWYGLNYAFSFLFGIVCIYYLSQWKNITMSWDDATDVGIYAFTGIVVGARVFYALVYNTSVYLVNPLKIFAVWEGGMSYHGGVIGVAIASYLYCKKHKLTFMKFADMAVIPATLGITTGRLTNFINGEIYGRVTDASWGVNFGNELANGALVFRHPSQLYEMVAYLFVLVVLVVLYRRNLPAGTVTFTQVTLVGFFRFFTEFFRAPDPQVGYLIFGSTMGQLLSVGLMAVGIPTLYHIWKTHKKKGAHHA